MTEAFGEMVETLAAWRLGQLDGDQVLQRCGPALVHLEQSRRATPSADEVPVPVYLLAWLVAVVDGDYRHTEKLRAVIGALKRGDLRQADSLVREHTLK